MSTIVKAIGGGDSVDTNLTALLALGDGYPRRVSGTWQVQTAGALATTLGVTTGGGGSTPTLTTSQTALGKLYAAFSTRDTQPVIVTVDGDSYSYDPNSNRWAARLHAALQAKYPKFDGTASPAYSTSYTPSRTSRGIGVQVVNEATGGNYSGDFIHPSTNARIDLAALQPNAYLWMIGTNDITFNTSKATFKSNLLGHITYQDANNPRPHVFVLIHVYPRPDLVTDSTTQALWDSYSDAMAEIAEANPGSVVYLNLAPAFALAGVPGSDPFDLVGTDNLHPTDGAGQAFLFDLIWSALRPEVALTTTAPVSTPTLTNTVLPAISGTAVTGQTLTGSNGTWSATPDSFTYAWKRDGSAISGATGSTYVLQVADEGHAITVTVTAVKASYTSGSATSASVTATNGSTPALSNTVLPTITGTATLGQTLTAGNGTWSATPDSFTYQWKRAGSAISGATGSTYVLVTADVGSTITVTVTAVKSGYTSGSATSAATGTVAGAGGPPTVTTGTLVGHWKADAITGLSDGATVTTWPDSSTQARTLTTGTGTPVYKTAILNGKPCVRFDGTGAWLGNDTLTANQPLTVFLVSLRPSAASGARTAVASSPSVDASIFFSTIIAAYAGNVMSGPSSAVDAAHVHEAVLNGASTSLGVDGTLATGNAGTNGFVGITVGSNAARNSEYWQGDIFEVIQYTGALSTGDRSAVRAYLGTKYGITVS